MLMMLLKLVRAAVAVSAVAPIEGKKIESAYRFAHVVLGPSDRAEAKAA